MRFWYFSHMHEQLSSEARGLEFYLSLVFCEPTSKLSGCVGTSELLLPAYVRSTKFSRSGPKVIKQFSFLTQLSSKFILLKNVKMPTIVGILTFISMINTTDLKQETSSFVGILVFMSS